jgi:hypothetical protein
VNAPATTRIIESRVFLLFAKLILASAVIVLWNAAGELYSGQSLLGLRLVPVFVGLFSFGFWALLLHYDTTNENRDREAQQLALRVARGSEQAFVLYLRPFVTDGRLRPSAESIGDMFSEMFSLGLSALSGFDSVLLEAAKGKVAIIQFRLKEPRFRENQLTNIRERLRNRIGSYYTQGDWENDFKQLVSAASLCVLVPPLSRRTGTALELNHLISSGAIAKTIIIMPGISLKRPGTWFRTTSNKLLWKNIFAIVNKRILLPHFRNSGGLAINTSCGIELVAGIGGRRWDTKPVLAKVLCGGALCTSTVTDALRVALWAGLILPLALAIAITMYRPVFERIPNAIPLFAALIVLAEVRWFYMYCQRFLLRPKSYRALWLFSLAASAGTLLLPFSPFPAPNPSLPDPFDNNLRILVVLMTDFSLPIIATYLVAYLVLQFRQPMEAAHQLASP